MSKKIKTHVVDLAFTAEDVDEFQLRDVTEEQLEILLAVQKGLRESDAKYGVALQLEVDGKQVGKR